MRTESDHPSKPEAVCYSCLCGLYGIGCIPPNILWTMLIGPIFHYGKSEEQRLECLPQLNCVERVCCPCEHAAAKNILCGEQEKTELTFYAAAAPWFWVRFFCNVLKDDCCDKKTSPVEIITSHNQPNPLCPPPIFEMHEIQPRPVLS